ncbi:AAA family ATPase [Streptococcus sp. sy018]|uniref:AAA family ATPase n=1 Tax=Streptococcus sp. sy018 TaxID=2600147 RepID=UPI0011B60687|nr:AAA family ATPase [Streptococcus sp. sy018]TWS95353.1 AAA family ATPase [Streptococcus sp. sy018]
MKYFQVELTNPDEFLKIQTEKFVADNRWILVKEKETYYLISCDDYSYQEMSKKFKLIFDNKVSLNKLEVLTENDFLKKIEKSHQGELVKFLLNNGDKVSNSILKPKLEKMEELDSVTGLDDFKSAVQNLVSYLSFQEEINNEEEQQHFYIFVGEQGSGRRFAIQFLEGLFALNAVVVNCDQYFLPQITAKDFPVTYDYLSARPRAKLDFFKNLREQGRHTLAIFMVNDNKEAKAIEKELLDIAYRVSIVSFPEYNQDELFAIGRKLLDKQKIRVNEENFRMLLSKKSSVQNAKDVRHLVQEIVEFAIQSGYDSSLGTEVSLDNFCLASSNSISQKNSAEETLQEMIGLTAVKSLLNQQLAFNKISNLRKKHGITDKTSNHHLMFTGNPGTGKTEVARLYTTILHNNNLIQENKIIEVGRAELVGEYIGQTAPKIKRVFDDAKGGVLFIDEAYSLIPRTKRDYGPEAIAAIIQEMENRRDEVLVIFAGYEDLMKEFLTTNPGLSSRISQEIRFEDYSPEELYAIFELMLTKKHYQLTEECKATLNRHFSALKTDNHFGNARYVRKLVEKVTFYQAQRVVNEEANQLSNLEVLSQVTLEDIDKTLEDFETKRQISSPVIGFGR